LISNGFVKVSAYLIRNFHKDGPSKTGRRKMRKAGSKQTRQRILKLKTKELKKVNEKLFMENI